MFNGFENNRRLTESEADYEASPGIHQHEEIHEEDHVSQDSNPEISSVELERLREELKKSGIEPLWD